MNVLLLADPTSDDDPVFAHVARVYVLADRGDASGARAAYRALAAIAPDDPVTETARTDLQVRFGAPEASEAPPAKAFFPELPVVALGLGPVVPNPTSGTARVAVGLADEGAVRVSVFDALGRRLASSELALGAGQHAVEVPTAGLAPGLYLVRVDASGRLAARTFTVAR